MKEAKSRNRLVESLDPVTTGAPQPHAPMQPPMRQAGQCVVQIHLNAKGRALFLLRKWSLLERVRRLVARPPIRHNET